jgi:hypothetical protein
MPRVRLFHITYNDVRTRRCRDVDPRFPAHRVIVLSRNALKSTDTPLPEPSSNTKSRRSARIKVRFGHIDDNSELIPLAEQDDMQIVISSAAMAIQQRGKPFKYITNSISRYRNAPVPKRIIVSQPCGSLLFLRAKLSFIARRTCSCEGVHIRCRRTWYVPFLTYSTLVDVL